MVKNPSADIKDIEGRTLSDMVVDQTKQFEDKLASQQAYFNRYPIQGTAPKKYTPEETQAMRDAFPMSSNDFETTNSYGITGIPDLTEGQGIGDIRNQNQVLGETELRTSTPQSLQNFQDPNFNERIKTASKESMAAKVSSKPDWRDYVRAGVGAVSNIKGVQEDAQGRMDLAEKVQNLNDQPRYMPNEYQYMARPGSQSVIFARHGAEVRTGTQTGAEEAELEQGEMFMLPNLDSYVVGGKKHSAGGEKFVLPQGTIVFSDYLKVPGTKKTFAQMAKGYDIEKYKETLENPHAKAVDRDTAQIMMDRNMKKLQELFGIQQAKNGNSTGEMETQNVRSGQAGLINVNQPQTFGPNAPSVLTPEQQKQYYLNQGMFNNPGYSNQSAALNTIPEYLQGNVDLENKSAQADELTKHLNTLDAGKKTAEIAKKATEAKPDTAAAVTPSASTPTTPAPPAVPSVLTPEQAKEFVKNQTLFGQQDLNNINDQLQQSTNTADKTGANAANGTTAGTVSKGNGADENSIYRKKTASGRSYYVEGQGEFKGKSYRDQYGGDVFNLVRNRLNEHYDELTPTLMSAYQAQLKNKNLAVGSAEDLVDVMESGNSSLVAMRNYFKVIGKEGELFDPALDKGAFDNKAQAKTAQLFKAYVESPQYAADVKAGKASTFIPWLKEQPKLGKNAKGEPIYTLENAEINHDYTENYQASYKAFAAVKKSKPELLKGYRVAPEGLQDHQWMGLPISPVDRWGGNTTIGQLSAFEDEEPIKPEKPKNPVKTGDGGGDWNKKVTGSPGGEYIKAPFDLPQLAPELYGMASSQMFAYQPMDYTAPYLMPQTLNIQPQLQDIDNSYTAAINAGADPNSALIATLGGKQRIYSEKQNFDAQQRAATDQYNAQARWQEDVYDMQSLDRVYNTLIAQADDSVTAQRQALIDSAAKKREMYNQEENRKALYINNFVRNYRVDGKTGAVTVNPETVTNLVDLGEMLYGNQTNQNTKKSTETTTTTTTK